MTIFKAGNGKGKDMIVRAKAFAKKGIKHINTIILSLYLFCVWAAYLFLYYYGKMGDLGFLAYLAGILVLIALVTNKIVGRLSVMQPVKTGEMRKRDKWVVFVVFTLICFGIMMLWFAALCPGSFSYDSFFQYRQAVTGAYNDWHPAWHTMVFFSFPLALTGKASSIVFFQILYFSLVMGYMCLVISKYANVRWAAAAMAYIMLNPFTGNILMYPWKDVAFAIAGLLAMAMSAELYLSGKKGGRWLYIGALGAVLANATIFRHNAILYTAVLAIALIVNLTGRQAVVLSVSFFLTLFIIKVPVYRGFGVATEVGGRVIETMGFPLTVIGNVAKEASWAFDTELADFVYSLAPQEKWKEIYDCGSFNSIKGEVDGAVVEEAGRAKILKEMLRCFRRAPVASLRGAIALTDMVYGFEGGAEGIYCSFMGENEYGIEYTGIRTLAPFLVNYTFIVNNSVFKYIFFIGTSMVFMLFAILSKCNLAKWKDWKRIFLCLPVFAYNFGTMLLLSGPDARFFFISFLVCPVVVTLAFSERKERANVK